MPPTSTPQPGPEPASRREWPPELLTAAVERAVTVARRDAATRGAPPPPSSMRPVLGFTKKLPARALRTVVVALETDDAFRARVAEGAEESALGRASWLFLERPEGWQGQLEVLAAEADEERRDTEALRTEQNAQRRAEQLTDSLERVRAELSAARAALEQAETAAVRERTARLELAAERDDLVSRVAALEQERADAVRQLKATEATSTRRLEELRSERAATEPLRERVRALEAELAESASAAAPPTSEAVAPSIEPSAWDGADPRRVADAVARAASAAAVLGEALAAAAGELAAPPEQPRHVDRPDAAGTAPQRAVRPSRRVPLRLRSGVNDGSPEGLAQLLGVDRLVAIVDGYNVTMEGWPSLDHEGQRSSLVRALGGLQARVPASIHVVFDGDAEGRRPSVGAPLPVRVHFSPHDVEADDVILEMVAGLPTDTPVAVVSSDRRVAEGARRLGANAVQSKVLLELLRR